MARFGSPFAAGFGSPQNVIKRDVIRPAVSGRPNQVLLQASPGFGGAYYGMYLDDEKVASVLVPEGVFSGPFNLPVMKATQSFQILREGHSSEMDLARIARAEEGNSCGSATISWTWVIEYLGNSYAPTNLSAWTFAGITPGSLINNGPLPRENALYTMTVVAGAATITLSNADGVIAQGTGSVGGKVTLAAMNDSGISGTVDVGAGATTENGTLSFRWPAGANVYRDTVLKAFVAFNSTIPVVRWTDPASLAAGTYAYTLALLSDLGTLGSQGSPVSITLTAPPLPVTALHYVSGAASALAIAWTGSATSGASYNLYTQTIADPYLDLNKGVAKVAGTTTATLAAQTGYPGIVRVLLRAVKSGVEERKGQLIEIELDAAGAVVAPRPNGVTVGRPTITGTSLTLPVMYATKNEAGVATTAKLFMRVAGGTYDYTNPDATATLSAIATGYKQATLAYTASGAGTMYAVVRAATAGSILSAADSAELTLAFDNSAPAAPAISGQAARG